MSSRRGRRTWAVTLCAAALLAVGAPPALGAAGDPSFVFVPSPPGGGPVKPPPVGYLVGPCGMGVDANRNFYVSDYYHDTVDAYDSFATYTGGGVTGATGYLGQVAGVDPLDGPCGLAFDSTNQLYVNDFDRSVIRYAAYPSFGAGTTIAGAGVDDAHPTGVAVDPATDDVYVDDRTYITGYDSSGNQLLDSGNPLKIGLGTLGEGYGLAIDLSGRLYVADASSNTVKVYDPAAVDKADPVTTIAGPLGGFRSLRQAAVAIDRSNGLLYVVDNLQPQYTEEPAAQVEVFTASTGSYLGVLKYRIVDALPPGLAVDQSGGRVYVTSGNTDQAGIYAYAAGSQISSSSPPAVGLMVSAAGTGGGAVTSSLGGIDCATTCSTEIRSGAQVTLSATPDSGSSFAGWSGAGCEGVGECTVAMDRAASVSASFEADPAAPSDPQPSGGSQPPPSTPAAGAPIRPRTAHHRPKHRRRHHRHHHRRVRHRHPRHRGKSR